MQLHASNAPLHRHAKVAANPHGLVEGDTYYKTYGSKLTVAVAYYICGNDIKWLYIQKTSFLYQRLRLEFQKMPTN